MRIALVHKHLSLRGGTERVLYRTAEGLRYRGHEVHLFCREFYIAPPPGVVGHDVPCISWPRTARFLSFAFLSPRVIARYACDVVMSFDRILMQDIVRSGGGPHGVFLQKMLRNGHFWQTFWYRISPYHRSVVSVERRQMSAAGSHRIIAVCQRVKREMMEAYGVPEEKIVVIHNGVDHRRFHPARRMNEGKKIREELGIPRAASVVLFVGTGFRRKGLDRLLNLWNMPELQEIYLLVVGNDARLSSYKKRWKGKKVFFVGTQPAVEKYYAAADVFVLPSTQEAFGNAVLEAMASGLPVVTVPEVGALDKIDGDLREGILMDRDDVQELKRKILSFLDNNRWPALSEQARRTAEKYSWEVYLSEVERLLSDVACLPDGLQGSQRASDAAFV